MSRRAFFERNLVEERKLLYKTNNFGNGDRGTRCEIAKENVKQRRKDEISKRRRMPLSTLETKNVNVTVAGKTAEKGSDEQAKVKDSSRYAQLLKWREERKKQIDQQEKEKKKKQFVVKHMTYSAYPGSVLANHTTAAVKTAKKNQKIEPKHNEDTKKEVVQSRRMTRSATRAAASKTANAGQQRKGKKTVSKKQTTAYSQEQIKEVTKTNNEAQNVNLKSKKRKPQEKKSQEPKLQELKPQELKPQEPKPQEPKLQEPKPQEPSFAPANYKFQPPTGVDSFLYSGENFKFRPLSPSSAEKFIMRTETQDVVMATIEEPSVAEPQLSSDNNSQNPEEEGSGKFRKCVEYETTRLQGLCSVWEKESNSAEHPLPEDVQGMIRTVIGQVQLLVTKKFKQFNGLIDLSEDPNAEKKTLVSDLQGFWEMIYFQVEDIDKKFKELDQLKLTNWELPKIEVKKPVTKKKGTKSATTRKPTSKTSANQSRNKFRELRSQMKAKLRETNCQDVPVTLYISPLKKLRLDTQCTPEVKKIETEEKPKTEEEPNFQEPAMVTRQQSSGIKPNNSTKKQNRSAKNECDSAKKISPSSEQGTVFDSIYLKPSTEVTPSNRNIVKSPQFFFTPTCPSQSQLVTPTPSKLTKTPVPEFLSPTFAADGQSSTLNHEKSTIDGDLMFFSPVKSRKTPRKEESVPVCGSIRKFAQVTPSKKLEAYFGDADVFSPVRRSARLDQRPSITSAQAVVDSLAEIPNDADYGYTPNKALFFNH